MNISGNPISKGIGIGVALIYRHTELVVDEAQIPKDMIVAEKQILRKGISGAAEEIDGILAILPQDNITEREIMSAHKDMILDEAFEESINCLIEEELHNACYAVDAICKKYSKRFLRSPDPLMRERAADMADISGRIIRNCRGEKTVSLSHLSKNTVIFAEDLLPSDTAAMDFSNVCGIATQYGGTTSHSAIIARSHAIPGVSGIMDVYNSVSDGDTVIIDGEAGALIINPDEETIAIYSQRLQRQKEQYEIEAKFAGIDAATADGVRITTGINIGSVSKAVLDGCDICDHIGLFRTEFLYMGNDHLPSENEQFDIYSSVLKAMDGKPTVLRTLDIGGDKSLPYFELPKEANPFLGVRGIRLCFANRDIYKTQLRAAIRASIFGNLWIMAPMVSSIDDIRRAKSIFEECKAELIMEGKDFSSNIKFGVMIEVPALAMIADAVAEEVDFASIGSNDLTQYLTASDRTNPDAQEFYQSYHPAVFKMIGMVTSAFNRKRKEICICGELGGDTLAVPALIGLGFRMLSMNPSALASVKYTLSRSNIEEMEELAKKVCNCNDSEEVTNSLTIFAVNH